MTATEARQPAAGGPQLRPLSVQAYRTLGELGLLPKNTELLYGQVFQKTSKFPFRSGLALRLLRPLQAALPAGWNIRPEQPITCQDSEPEPDLAVVRGTHGGVGRRSLRDQPRFGPEARIEVFRRPVSGDFTERTVHGPGGRFTSAAVPGLTVEVAAVLRA